jgi:hypothetical protein
LFAERALVHIKTGKAFNPLLHSFLRFYTKFYFLPLFIFQSPGPAAVNTITPYFHKTPGQYMHAKPPEELSPSQDNGFLAGIIAIIFVHESHTITID